MKELAMNARRLGMLSLSAALACGAVSYSAWSAGPPRRQGLEGTWMFGVANSTPFLALQTYTQDGQYLGETNSTASRSLEHGEWFKVGPRQYIRSSVNFRFAPPPAEP